MCKLILCAALCGGFVILTDLHPGFMIPALLFLAVLLIQSLQLLLQSRTDSLTGLYNLRHLEAMRGKYRHCSALTVYYFDLDHLKLVNDTKGHASGDRILTEFAALLRPDTHNGNCAYRIGGDEFLLIIPSRADISLPETEISYSWGCAAGSGELLLDLIRQAEQDMYCRRKEKTTTEA